MSRKTSSTVLTIRVPSDLDRRLSREARRTRRTRSEAARVILEAALAGRAVDDPHVEAGRQSRIASERAADQEVLEFIAGHADLRGWQ